MSGALGDSSALGWASEASRRRRSARLSTASPAFGQSAPATPADNSHRSSTRARRSRNMLDASSWSASLYSAGRDPQVSSYYLRVGDEDTASQGSDLSGLGSLLRGAQRPPATPNSFMRSASLDNSYAEEDAFMAQVENEWEQRSMRAGDSIDAGPTAKNAASPTESQKAQMSAADSSVFAAPQTPHVPGLFRSVLSSEPRRKRAERETDSGTTYTHIFDASPWIWRAFFLLALVTAIVYYIFTVQRLPSAPLVPSLHGEDVHARVSALEGALNKVWRSLNDVTADVKQKHREVTERLSVFEKRYALSSTLQTLEADVRALRSTAAEHATLWKEEQKRIESLAARVTSAEKHGVKDVLARLAEIDVRVSHATAQAAAADAAAVEVRKNLEPLRAVLPEHMPVRYDPKTKQLRIDPALWYELRKVFASRGSSRSKDDHGAPASSWSAFLAEHRAELEHVFTDIMHDRTTDGTMLDRASFMQLMEGELARAKLELSARFNENVHDFQNEVLEKVRRQQDMYEQSGSWKHPADAMDLDTVRGLIDAALAKYSADEIARADYAQYTAGARVIPQLTSPTHEVRVNGPDVHGIFSMLHHLVPLPTWFGGKGGSAVHTVRGRMPVVALHHDTAPGMCWPFAGSQGQLGIQLVRRIHVTAVTIDHVPGVLAVDGMASAPRDMEVWGVVETDEERRRVARWRRAQSHTNAELDPSPVPPSPAHVYLGSFSYDTRASAAIQTFPVSAPGLDVGFRAVQLNVLSNHGQRDFTCLYRVRVHGEEM